MLATATTDHTGHAVITIAGSEVTGADTWSAADIGDLTGRVALVTGANSGIGYETARALAEHGAHVIMACRYAMRVRLRRARDKLESELERSSLEILHLNLADLVSVRRAADEVLAVHARLDLLVNNAGVMGTPYRQTVDGFELQMATNHLGHFALTGLLLDRIVTTARSRIVTVSSHLHRMGQLRLDDVAGTVFRRCGVADGTSKLANLLFVAELSRRLQAAGLPTLAVAAHPGWTWSNPGRERRCPRQQPCAPKARAAGRVRARAIGGGRSPSRAVRRHLVVRQPGRVRRPCPPLRALRPTQLGVAPSRHARDPQSAAALGQRPYIPHGRALFGRHPGLSSPLAGHGH